MKLKRILQAVAIVAAVWVVGCGEPQPPVAVGSIPKLLVGVGSIESVDLVGYFSDPDGDELRYEASSSDGKVATVVVSSDSVAVTGVASGSAEITVTASDGSLSASQNFAVSVLHGDWRLLAILYDELGGDGWADNTNWKTDKPLDEWYGVSANADGRVDELVLWENRLTGEIPSELGTLSDLNRLDLDFNSLTGEIPSELGNLSNLRILGLSGNSLTGEIPLELGGLSNLRSLHLEGNSLTGEIPSELGGLSNLRGLHLDVNSFTGEIPVDFLDLSSLELFYWDDNDGLCVPDTSEFDDWLYGLLDWVGLRCD